MNILQITIFFKRRTAHNKGSYSQNMVRCLGRISYYDAFRKIMCNCEGHILRAYIYHVFFFLRTYFEKGIACARGFIIDIEVD